MDAYALTDPVDLLHGALDGERSGHITGHPDREEQCVEAAFTHPRDVDAPTLVAAGGMESLLEEQPLSRVGVRIDDDGALVEPTRPGGQFIDLTGLCGNVNRRRGKEDGD